MPAAPAPWAQPERERSRRFRVRPIYVVLFAMVIAATAVTLIYQDRSIVDRFGSNLATETLGILLTLVFVHRFLNQQDREQRLRGSIGALRRVSRPLGQMLGVWAALVKGSFHGSPAERPTSFDELFASYRTDDLAKTDPTVQRIAEDGSRESWFHWAVRELSNAQDSLRELMMAYGPSLDPSYVEAIDDVVDDAFLRLLQDLTAVPSPDPQQWRVRLNHSRTHREIHFKRLLRALEQHNRLAREAAAVRTSAPRSNLGIELEMDSDLKVGLTLDEDWWRREPAPGALIGERRQG